MWCPDPPAVAAPRIVTSAVSPAAEGQRGSGQVDRGRVGQQPEAPGQTMLFLVDRLIYQELRHVQTTDTPAPAGPSAGWKWLIAAFIAWGRFGPESFTARPTTPCAEPTPLE
jgi:hypothetical protein